ncbi:hypothetical protein [Aliarcobacter lanthieri]|uniref:hypothetical protein n=1 Tax=Aliarcobacter lanthieri TaxID=1355374 RepID=UPI003AAD2D38
MDNLDLIKLATVSTENIKLECLKGTKLENKEFKIRQLTIDESEEYLKILNNNPNNKKAIYFALKHSMIEPTFFKEEDLKNLNATGKMIIDEVFNYIPLIGLSEDEKEEYYKKMTEAVKEVLENQEDLKKKLKQK